MAPLGVGDGSGRGLVGLRCQWGAMDLGRFFLPLQVGRIAWEQRRWGLVAINGAFDLVRLRLFATILSYWRLGW